MSKTNRNTTVVVSVLSVMIIIALTASGIGGRGSHAMTAYASNESPHQIQTGTEALTEEFLDSVKNRLAEQASLWEGDFRYSKTETKRDLEEKPFSESGREEEFKLKERAKEPDSSSAVLGREDYEVLLKIVEAEAGVCDSKGKILVANVILNRVHSQEFPDTIREVVYQPSQFSPVSNGSINTCKVTEQTVECVNRALKGEDYSQGALYFMNRTAARSKSASWFDNRLDFLFSHQGHEFFK